MKALLLFWSCWHGVPNYEDGACLTSEAKHLMGDGGRRMGHCLWVGEATAVHRCSRVLSRCSTSPPSNWQMASDARWFNGLRVCFFLPQSAISRDICNELARRTAESGSWEQHFLMGGSVIVTDLGGNQRTLSYFFWVMIIETSRFKLSAAEEKAIINRLMLFTQKNCIDSNSTVLRGINCVTVPFWLPIRQSKTFLAVRYHKKPFSWLWHKQLGFQVIPFLAAVP